jgi:hypothetical protein
MSVINNFSKKCSTALPLTKVSKNLSGSGISTVFSDKKADPAHARARDSCKASANLVLLRHHDDDAMIAGVPDPAHFVHRKVLQIVWLFHGGNTSPYDEVYVSLASQECPGWTRVRD